MRDVLEGHSAEFFSGIPNRVAQGLIDFEPLATERHQGHADGRILKCTGKTFFTEPERLLAFFALGHVDMGPNDAYHLIGIVQNRSLGRLDVTKRSIRKSDAEFRSTLRF